MFGMGQTRENVKRINGVSSEGYIDQLKLNIFMLVRDMAFLTHGVESVKDISLKNIIGPKKEVADNKTWFSYICNDSMTDFIKELITPEITESRFVSKERLSFLRDVYSLNGSPLKSFNDMRKKYGKKVGLKNSASFDDMLQGTLSQLNNTIKFGNDTLYLYNYLDKGNYFGDDDTQNFYDFIIFGREEYHFIDDAMSGDDWKKYDHMTYEHESRLKERNEEGNAFIGFTAKEAIGIINNNYDRELEKLDDFEEWAKFLKDNQDKLLLAFLKNEFMQRSRSTSDEDYNKGSEYTNSRLNEIIEGNVSDFVQHINEKFQIDFKPTEGMIDEFNKFKKYYTENKLLEQKNNLLYEKNRTNNGQTIHLINKGVAPSDEKEMSLEDLCIECDEIFAKAMGGAKTIY